VLGFFRSSVWQGGALGAESGIQACGLSLLCLHSNLLGCLPTSGLSSVVSTIEIVKPARPTMNQTTWSWCSFFVLDVLFHGNTKRRHTGVGNCGDFGSVLDSLLLLCRDSLWD